MAAQFRFGRRRLRRGLPLVLHRQEAARNRARRGSRGRGRGALAAFPAHPTIPPGGIDRREYMLGKIRQRRQDQRDPCAHQAARALPGDHVRFRGDPARAQHLGRPSRDPLGRVERPDGPECLGGAAVPAEFRRGCRPRRGRGAVCSGEPGRHGSGRSSKRCCRPIRTGKPSAQRSRRPSAWASRACPVSCSTANMRSWAPGAERLGRRAAPACRPEGRNRTGSLGSALTGRSGCRFSASRASCVMTTAEPASRFSGVGQSRMKTTLLVRPDLGQRRPARRCSATSPAGLAKRCLRKWMTTPFGPASTFSTLALRHSALMETIFEQVLDLLRQRPEAVDQLGARSASISLGVVEVGEPAVEAEPELQIGDVVFRDHHRRADGDLRRPAAVLGASPPALQRSATASSSICW